MFAIPTPEVVQVPEVNPPNLVDKSFDAPSGQLPSNAVKEQFSLALTRMIAYESGCSVQQHDTDYDGVDLTVVSSAVYEASYMAKFDLQLKCTTRQDRLRGDHVVWEMEAGPYQKLTSPKRYDPAFLAVLLLPNDSAWLSTSEECLVTHGRMYWQAASELPPLRDGQQSVTVRLPRSNLFIGEQLRSILKTIGDRPRFNDQEGGVW